MASHRPITREPGVLLLSAPWPNHRSPSIQIAALKAFLTANGVSATADHFFLRVAAWLGLDRYAAIWTPYLDDGEALYGAMLFPQQMRKVLASESIASKGLAVEVDGERLPIPSRRFFRAFADMHERALDELDLEHVDLVGLTLNFGQTLASAYIASRIKARAPHVKVVVGGAEATGALGRSLLDNFPQLDFACSGEGEQSLLKLARALRSGDWSSVPGSIASRSGGGAELGPEVSKIAELPLPDFSDYFALAVKLGLDPLDLCEYLPFETSRGCYYSCSFCSLNLQWKGYRQSSPEIVASKVAELRSRHGRLHFFFVDNITPVGVSLIADELAGHGVDYRFFYEARVNLDRDTWRSLAAAGLRTTQLGIEALSDDLLRIYNKKSAVIHNVQALKHCYEYGIHVTGNVILGHPLARQEHVSESLRTFEYMTAYPPALSFSHYALLVGSPDYKNGIEGVSVQGNYSGYSRAYPPQMLDTLDLPRKAFTVDRADFPADFEPLVRAIEAWERSYSRHQARFGGREPILSMQDGGDFLRIEDWRSGTRVTYDLDARERSAYLALADVARLGDAAVSSGLDLDWMTGFVDVLDSERLAFRSGPRALALATRRRGAPA